MRARRSLVPCCLVAMAVTEVMAGPELRAARTDAIPIVDGRATDAAWANAKAIRTRDPIAGIDITIKAVHDGVRVAFLVRYPDASEDRQHKTMIWHREREMYMTGPNREDAFVFKWSMEPIPVDLTLSANAPYRADVWYWKAHRTDHAGYADDKYQLYVDEPLPNAKRLVSDDGNLFYLTRSGDSGRAAYRAAVHPDYIGEEAPRFELQTPDGSRADIVAKGRWEDGFWTIELSRRLTTGNPDDVAFSPSCSYRFGVSRFEIAGRSPDPRLVQPLFASGDIGEHIELKFD